MTRGLRIVARVVVVCGAAAILLVVACAAFLHIVSTTYPRDGWIDVVGAKLLLLSVGLLGTAFILGRTVLLLWSRSARPEHQPETSVGSSRL